MNYKYKCIAIDDEPLALSLIETYIKKTPELEFTGAYSNAMQAMEKISTGGVDIVFSDIQMPGINGIELAKILPEHTYVIFITAYQDYALDGFKVNAVDYLLKPVQYVDFRKATFKAARYINSTQLASKKTYLTIRSNYQIIKLDTADILYIEAAKDYMRVVTTQKEYLTLVTLKQLIKSLPDTEFVKVHRSFVVNRRRIKILTTEGIVIGNRTIPVSDSMRGHILNVISNN